MAVLEPSTGDPPPLGQVGVVEETALQRWAELYGLVVGFDADDAGWRCCSTG